MRHGQDETNRHTHEIKYEQQEDSAGKAVDKAAGNRVRECGHIEAMNVVAEVRCHTADDQSGKVEVARTEAPKRQDRCWMRKRARHRGVLVA